MEGNGYADNAGELGIEGRGEDMDIARERVQISRKGRDWTSSSIEKRDGGSSDSASAVR